MLKSSDNAIQLRRIVYFISVTWTEEEGVQTSWINRLDSRLTLPSR